MTVTEETTTDVTGAASSAAAVEVDEVEVADSETTGSTHVVDETTRPEGDRPVATLADLDEVGASRPTWSASTSTRSARSRC